MARVTVSCTDDCQAAMIISVTPTAEWLMLLGRTAAPCTRSGCKRPLGHGGSHYFNEDDHLNEPQPLRVHRR